MPSATYNLFLRAMREKKRSSASIWRKPFGDAGLYENGRIDINPLAPYDPAFRLWQFGLNSLEIWPKNAISLGYHPPMI